MSPHRDNSKKFPLLGESVEIFIFLTITMSVAEAWLGGIGEYPPHPSRLAIPPSSVGFASGHRGVLLNLSGFGGYSPIPPRHASAIVSVIFRKTDMYFVNLRGDQFLAN